MKEKLAQWGTGIYDTEGEVPLCDSGSGLGGLRLKRLGIVKGIRAADLPDPLAFGVNVGNRMDADGDVVMSPELFMDLLSAHATAVVLKRAVAASGIDVPSFANTKATPDHHTVAEYLGVHPSPGTGTKPTWKLHPQSSVADVPCIARHIRAWHTPSGPHMVEVPVDLFFIIGDVISASGLAFAQDSNDVAEDLIADEDLDGDDLAEMEPRLATASLLQYEHCAILGHNAPGDYVARLNAKFADDWKFDRELNEVVTILKRPKV